MQVHDGARGRTVVAADHSKIGRTAFAMPDEEKRAQEIRPFKKINDSFKKIIITKDIVPSFYDENGILTMNIYDFLLDGKSLGK